MISCNIIQLIHIEKKLKKLLFILKELLFFKKKTVYFLIKTIIFINLKYFIHILSISFL